MRHLSNRYTFYVKVSTPRYCRQIGSSDCGPIAILNILKWAGLSVTLKEYLPYLNTVCRIDNFGTPLHRFNAMILKLRKNRFQARYRKQPRLDQIEKHLAQGGSVLIFYFNGQCYHFSLIIGSNENGSRFTMVNESYGKTVSKVTRKTLKRFLRLGEPAAWLISKVQQI